MESSTNQAKSVQLMIQQNKRKKNVRKTTESLIPTFLLISAVISVLTTVGIFFTLLRESIVFFTEVSFAEFFLSAHWSPWTGSFGVLSLIAGTLLITLIAIAVALPLGFASAVYLSEYATPRTRRVIKPVLEVLAGIPTVVYGFFALTFVTPILQSLIPGLLVFNALSAGIVVGIMIVPMIASLSEDAMNAVPNSLREGALAMGATKLETTFKVVVPAALSGIVASVVLGISRAIGETMIVTIAAGASPNLTFNPLESIQTLTSFIVQGATGDTSFGSTIYYSIYAVGMTLFVFTFAMNLLSQYIVRKFKEDY
ncbi:phosphate ABC transporter permease subunit PstC [Planococcus lenghuensis]|uniref:Phosphate transport system permease protein n=1 Tax=Planococcus lenghuensis TaxID=2213202 RepID=A0A1Q2L4S5_9BACL|nr:phosphate ABC transporter permease subunit PstC [Planococcus lenghuensis]AQQ55439.1 phosphate ABC transporter permease subunit PstC [Planococcus lenghuensis]